MYEMLTFFYMFNYHSFGFLGAGALMAYVFYRNDFSLILTQDRTMSELMIGTVVFMGLSIYHRGMPLISELGSRYISPMVMYMVGYSLAMISYRKWEINLIVGVVAAFLHGALNVAKNINTNVLYRTGRAYVDIAGELMSATLQNLFFVMSSSMLFYFLVCCKKPVVVRVLGASMTGVGMIGTIHNASRTLIGMTGLLFFVALVIYLYNENEYMDTVAIKLGIFGFVIIFMAVVAYSINIFGIKEMIANSALGERSSRMEGNNNADITSDLRWVYAGSILSLLPAHPFGNVPYGHYAHNLWVDAARDAGFIPLVMYTLFAWRTMRKVVWMVRSYLFTTREKVLLVPIVAAIFISCFIEPVVQGAPYIFATFCFISGCLTCMTDCAAETGKLEIIPEKRVRTPFTKD